MSSAVLQAKALPFPGTSFRSIRPPIAGRPTRWIPGKTRTLLKNELAAIQDFGENRTAKCLFVPGLAGDTGPPSGRVSGFWVYEFPSLRADS
jgi:hypothetical protein